MAPKKKKNQYKPKASAGGPSTTLVIFLVFFILVSIITGVAAYYGYAGQEEFKTKAKQAEASRTAAEKAQKYYQFMALEARAAVGAPFKKDDKTDEQNLWQIAREDFQRGAYNDDALYPENKMVQVFVKENDQLLNFNGATKMFGTTYKAKIQELQTELANLKQKIEESEKAKDRAEKVARDWQTKFEPVITQAIAGLNAEQAKELQAALQKSDETKHLIEENNKLKREKTEMQLAEAAKLRDKEGLINQLVAKVEQLSGNKQNPQAPIRGPSTEPHALLLDVSKGKTLWDQPKGKITRVDTAGQTVHIDIGSADGAHPTLTFNVFAVGWDKKAAGSLKGTIEIINVLNEKTSEARITSLYDAEGIPIPLYNPSKGATLRSSDNPLKEGDLLYNLLWRTRVAFAGRMNFEASNTFTAAEDMRNLKQFMGVLRSQDIAVDAYLDLTDGKIRGEIRPQTRFLIMGEPAYEDLNRAEQDPKIVTPKDINAKIAEMRKQAAEQGLFIISAHNFAAVIGYRPPQSADSTEVPSFRPSLPRASNLATAPAGGADLPPLPGMEKKE